jgi:hypothetical protein
MMSGCFLRIRWVGLGVSSWFLFFFGAVALRYHFLLCSSFDTRMLWGECLDVLNNIACTVMSVILIGCTIAPAKAPPVPPSSASSDP